MHCFIILKRSKMLTIIQGADSLSKFCTGCGNQLREDVKFCRLCGLPVKAADLPAAPEQTVVDNSTVKRPETIIRQAAPKTAESKTGKRIMRYFVLLLVVCSVAATVYLSRDNLWDAWLKRGETVSVSGVALREQEAASFVNSPDEAAWKNQEDVEKVKKTIDGQISKFQKAARNNDMNNILKFFSENKRELYGNILEKDKDSIDLLGEAFEGMEMVYLSPAVNGKADTKERIAEYRTEYKGQAFSVVFIYQDGKWLIHSL